MTNVQKAYEYVYRTPNSKSSNYVVGTFGTLGSSEYYRAGKEVYGLPVLKQAQNFVQAGISPDDGFGFLSINSQNEIIDFGFAPHKAEGAFGSIQGQTFGKQ